MQAGCCYKKFKITQTILFLIFTSSLLFAQDDFKPIDLRSFWDSAHHWRDINDEEKTITPLPDQPTYKRNEITKIADNILLYQKNNGGWPKNYDMTAILTEEQIEALLKSKDDTNTTFDNGSTHAQVNYLAKVYRITKEQKYLHACSKGIEFILSAQYDNGGWPQFYPDTSGYKKYITFNDGAMAGIMLFFQDVVNNKDDYNFLGNELITKINNAYNKGIECIINCQIKDEGKIKAWCQQHDNIDFHPRNARTFEPAAVCSDESVGIIYILMNVKNPDVKIIKSINAAIAWLNESKIHGIRVETIDAPLENYNFHSTDKDRVVIEDPEAPPIWARYYELGTNRPLFCNRDGKPVYTLAEVHRERRTGYSWYGYSPAEIFKIYHAWQKLWSPDFDALQ